MRQQRNTDEPSARVLAELSALADGTLDPGREPAVRQLIEDSPELRERFERERRAVNALHATRSDRAPDALRTRIEAQRRAADRPRRRLAVGAVSAAALAVVVLALALVLPAAGPTGVSVSQAAALAVRGPVAAAPRPASDAPATKLSQDVEEVYFPNWASRQWWPTGMRKDVVGGREAVTVYYADRAGREIAYTIVASPPLRRPSVRLWQDDGTSLQAFTLGNRLVVTWRRKGDTCILSATGVSQQELASLAAWEPKGLDS